MGVINDSAPYLIQSLDTLQEIMNCTTPYYGNRKVTDLDRLKSEGIVNFNILAKEYQLVINKNSNRSSSIRKIIVSLYEDIQQRPKEYLNKKNTNIRY